jgi:hypothetical protein
MERVAIAMIQGAKIRIFYHISMTKAPKIVKKSIAEANSSLFTLHFSLLFCTFAAAITR